MDYGIEKLSNSQLMIKKLSDNTFTPDRLYVNVNKLGALGQGIAFDQVYTGDGATTPSGATGPSGADGADGASANISYLTNRFTGNGVVSGFEMTRSISTADEIFVFVNGLVQDSGENFSVTNGTGLFFSSGEIASGDKIMVRHIY